MVRSAAVPRHGDDEDGAVGAVAAVDDRCGGDADFRRDKEASEIIAGGCAGEQSGDVPESSAAVGVESVDAVVLGDRVDDVVSLIVDRDVGEVERFGFHPAVSGEKVDLAEGCGIDVGGSQDGLVGVETGAGVVVVIRDDVEACGSSDGESQSGGSENGIGRAGEHDRLRSPGRKVERGWGRSNSDGKARERDSDCSGEAVEQGGSDGGLLA